MFHGFFLVEVSRDFLRLDGLDVVVLALGASGIVEEDGEIRRLEITAGPSLVRIVEVRSSGMERTRI